MKTDGIASAAYALRYWERRQDVASNNLANVNTTGFKGERVFARLVGDGVPVPEAATDFREGVYQPTGNPLDLATRGNNYFVVNTAAGERWTRGGAWSVDPKGFLADSAGNQVLGEKGPIRVAGGALEVDRSGWVIVDRIKVDRLRLETPAPNAVLQHEGGTHFVPDTARTTVAYADRDIMQGSLEGSNVTTITSLVDLISIQRNFADAQKVLTTLDGIRSTIVNELGKA
jgi:flagellar basal-body rod protein FlgG